MRKQGLHELVGGDTPGFRFEHDAYWRFAAGFIADGIQYAQYVLAHGGLFGRKGFFAAFDFRIGEFLDFFQHFLRGCAGRQFGDDGLPLSTRQFLDFPACAHFQAAASAGIDVGDGRCRRDDLATARKVGAGDDRHQFVMCDVRIADHGDGGTCHFVEIVRRDFGRQTDGDAGCTVEQGERQACREQARFLGGTVVVVLEFDGTLADFIKQKGGDRSQTGFGVAHGSRTVSVT